MSGWGRVLALVAGTTWMACVDETSGLTSRVDAGASPSPQCDDRVACTEDVIGPDGACQHIPRDEWCGQDPCLRGVCLAGAGCGVEPVPDGTICADGPPCAPYACRGGRCAQALAPDGTICDDGDPCTTGEVCAQGACVAAAQPAPSEVLGQRFLIDQPTTATFVRDRLLVEIPAGGPRLRWVERAGSVAAPTSDAGLSMDGSARLFPLEGGGWVRLGYGGTGEGLIFEQIVDDGTTLSSPGGATVADRPRAAPDLVTRAGALYFCALDEAGQVRLHGLDVPPAGASPRPMIEALDRDPCRVDATGGLAARGAYWVRWENSSTGPLLTAYEMTAEGAVVRLSFSYAPDGAHQYGQIEGVAVDADGFAVLAVQNPRWVYIIDLVTGAIDTAALDRPEGLQLLAVKDRRAIFRDGADLVIYGLEDLRRPTSRRVEAAIEGAARALDVDAERLALVDGQGRLHWFDPGPAGPYAQAIEVRGQGSLADVAPVGEGLLGWSERHLLRIDPSWLVSGGAARAPQPTLRPPDAAVAAVTLAGGGALVGRPRDPVSDGCRSAPPGRCPVDVPVEADPLPVYRASDAGLVANEVILRGLGVWPAVAVRGGQAFHLVPRALSEPWLSSTRWDGAQLVLGPTVAGPFSDAASTEARIDVHPEGVTVRTYEGAALFGRGPNGLEGMLAQVDLPNTVGAAWFPPRWYVFTEGADAAPRAVEVFVVDGDGASPVSRQALGGAVDRVVGQDEAVVYTSAGGRLELWRPTDEGLVSTRVLQTVSPVMNVVGSEFGTLLVRPDGLTVLSAACW